MQESVSKILVCPHKRFSNAASQFKWRTALSAENKQLIRFFKSMQFVFVHSVLKETEIPTIWERVSKVEMVSIYSSFW